MNYDDHYRIKTPKPIEILLHAIVFEVIYKTNLV